MTFTSRPIDVIQNDMFSTLQQQGVALTDIAPGSVLYTLIRSFASIHNNQELSLEEFSREVSIQSASRENLDRFASDYGITRKPGAASSGFVLVTSNEETRQIPLGLILTDPNTGLQFQVDGENSYFVSAFAEASLPISCTTFGELGNLVAGTRLISPTYPNYTWIVGSHRTTSGEVCGDLTGGLFIETDEQLRSRISTKIINSQRTTDSAIENLILSDSRIAWASIKTPLPGYVQVWVDSTEVFDQEELDALALVAEVSRPAGTILSVHQATRIQLDITVQVKAIDNSRIQELTDQITTTVQNYLLSLDLGGSFTRSELTSEILRLGVSEATIISPNSDLSPESSEVIRASSIKVTYITTSV
jgi:uncharacterized phage protein gp47/JayE